MNGFCVILVLGLVATAAMAYPSKQLRIRQVVVPPAGSAIDPNDPKPQFQFFDLDKARPNPQEDNPPEIVEVADVKPLEDDKKKPFQIVPEEKPDGEDGSKGDEPEEKVDEDKKEDKEDGDKPKGGDKKPEEEKVEDKDDKEDEPKGEEKPKGDKPSDKPEEDARSAVESAEESGEGVIEIDPQDESGEIIILPGELRGKVIRPAPKQLPNQPSCGNGKEFQKRVEAVIAELHELKELCCQIEAVAEVEKEAE